MNEDNDRSVFTHVTAVILAAVAKIDGKVLIEENHTASLLLDMIAKTESKNYYKEYQLTLNDQHIESLGTILNKFSKTASLAEKYELIRSCWYMAQCDHELHSSESDLIYQIGKSLDISKRDCDLAKKSCI